MMPQQPKYRRKQYFVKKDYQLKFILKFCLVILAGSIISTLLLLLFSEGTLTSSFEHSRLVVKNTAIAIIPAVILTNIITLAIVSLIAIVVVLFISHKIAGPMFRFEKELKDIGQGNLTKTIKLRERDQFTTLAESLNLMTAGLRERVLAIQIELEQLLESASKQDISKELMVGLSRLEEDIRQHFKV